MQGLVEEIQELVLVSCGGRGQEVEVEVAPDDRGNAEHIASRPAETSDAGADDRAQALRQGEIDLRLTGHPTARGVLDDGSGLGELAEDLGHEERVAVGLLVDAVGEGHARLVEFVTGGGLHERHHVGVVEAFERECAHPGRLAVQGAQGLGEGMGDREFGIAVGAENEQPCRGRVGRYVAQQLEARLVGPVQVVEDQDDRVLFARRVEEVDHGAVEEVALGFGIRAPGGGQAAEALAESGHQPGQLGPVGGHMGLEQRFGCVSYQVAEGLGKGAVGRRHLLVAAPEQDRALGVVGPAGELGHQRGLALARLARDQDDFTPFPRRHAFVGIVELLELVGSADHPDAWAVGQAGRERDPSALACPCGQRFPGDLEGPDRFGQPLQLEPAEGGEDLGAAPAGGGSHQVGDKDLPRFGLGAQTGCLDDRVAEVVVTLLGGLSGAHPHTDPEGPVTGGIVAIDRLLHGDGAFQGVRGALEHHHQAVTQVLHLGAGRSGYRLAKAGEMGLAHVVGGVG